MKQFRRFLWVLLLIGMAIAIYSSAVGETAPEKINWGGAEPAAGSWARTADAMEFSYPMDAARDEPTILLRSAWQKYQVLVDGNAVYTASSERNGAFHLFRLPPGQELTVRFLDCAPGSGAESAVLQSQVYFGSRSGIQWMILRENLYAVLFSGFALVLGIACLLAAYCMQRQHFGNLYGSVYSLGAYILLAGVWVLTDSKILLLVSQKAGLAGLISYLSFYALHLPLLQFTIGVLPEKRRMLEILQAFYSGLLLLLMANFILSLPYLNVLVMAEHLLMTVTIALILYHGFREMRRGKNKALGRVMAGYVLFAVCSILAITIYYLDSSLPYSPVYMLGIFGFILLLALGGGAVALHSVYTVRTVYVEGNVHYTEDEIMEIVMSGPLGDNSLYLSLKYRDRGIQDIPFVDVMNVSILAPDTIKITVYEKALAGYVKYLDTYMYFDKDGYVVESSGIRTQGIPQITGLSFNHVVLGEQLPVEDPQVFSRIMDLTKLLNKYSLAADKIYLHSSGDITIYFGQIKVSMGSDNSHIEDKLQLLPDFLEKLQGKSGTLQMENYEEGKGKFTFKPDA